MTTAAARLERPVQPLALGAAAIVIAGLFLAVVPHGERQVALLAIGIAMGVTLYHAAYSFSAGWRRLLLDRDLTAVTAQLIMIAVAVVLFAPVLAGVFGRAPGGAVAPVSLAMAFGAFVFGIGMQLGGGCASGTLYTAGGANLRMVVVLLFFCLGGFWASLDLSWWMQSPALGSVSLGRTFGWVEATLLQLAMLAAIWGTLRASGARVYGRLWIARPWTLASLATGPWPLLLAAGLLAGLNLLTLLVAGHPWSITWGFALWTAKIAATLGWDPAASAFWSGGFQQAALARPVWADTVSVMNFGILAGAFAAAAAAGRVAPTWRLPLPSLAAAVIGGLMMGYGARLAFGCNIGALFSGIASFSLHGWVWIAAAVSGAVVGAKLRPLFRLPR